MKISILAVTMEFDDQHAAGPQSPPSPSDGRPRNDNLLADLLFDLLREKTKVPRTAWEGEPHGPFFKV